MVVKITMVDNGNHGYHGTSHLQISFLKRMVWSPKWYHYVALELLYLFATSVYVSHLSLKKMYHGNQHSMVVKITMVDNGNHGYHGTSHLQISFLKRMVWSPKWYHYVALELLYLFATSVYLSHLYLLRNVENE